MLTPPATALDWLVEGPAPSPTAVNALLSHHGHRLCDADREDLRRSLQHSSPGVRCMAAVRMCSALATGLDARAAAALSTELLPLIQQRWPSLSPQLGERPMAVVAVALDGWIRAHYAEGHRQALMERWAAMAQVFPALAREVTYWNAGCFAAEARLRNNDVASTQAFLRAVPADLAAHVSQLQQLEGHYEGFTGGRFELEVHPTVGEQGQLIMVRSLRAIEQQVVALLGQLKADAHAVPRLDPVALEGLIDELRAQIVLAESALTFEQKYRELTPRANAWRQGMWRFMNPGRWDLDHLNRDWVENCLERVAAIQSGAVAPADLPAEARQALRDIGRSLPWARAAGDWHTLWTLRWSAVVVYDRMGDDHRMARALDRLCQSLRASRLDIHDPEAFSVIANFFQGLGDKVVQLQQRVPEADRLMNVFELRRSRALVAARAEVAIGAGLDWHRPQLLGPRTHYLGYTVLHEPRQVYATLLTADGHLAAQCIDIDWDDLLRAMHQLDPTAPLNPLRRSAWQVLAPLMQPLETALAAGRLQPGDHVCLAAEDPINLVPLAALPCAGQPLFRRVSIARVASLADAIKLSRLPARRPDRATAVFVDGLHKDPLPRRAHFADNVAALTQWLACVDAHAPPFVTREALQHHLAPNTLLHLHAHGAFEAGEHPLVRSGIVVSDGLGPPPLNGRAPLLTPQDLIDAAPDLRGSHMTLNACVSGQGLPGKGGDLLGLEMALRLCGIDSLLATHWHVHSADACAFSNRFYQLWLQEGLGRGKAWQQAIESLADPTAPVEQQARWCAFSLFGLWH